MPEGPQYPDVKVQLVGTDGNAFALIARVTSALREAGHVNAVDEFRKDLTVYLEAVRIRNRKLPNLAQAWQVWSEALGWLRDDYWRRFLFDPESELAGLTAPPA